MENFKLEVWFHAENLDDALNQAKLATEAFDDGYEDACISKPDDPWKVRRVI